MSKKKLLLYVLSLLCFPLWATHQRSGEISYVHVSGLTYRFTFTTYTYTPSPADRPEIEVLWGDGSSSILTRSSKVNLSNDISCNIYVGEHTYSGNGTFTISFEDPNRNAGIVNIPNSVNIPFYIETTLIINPFLGGNNSPQLHNPPIDNGCTNVPYYHNPGAYDADGDSLSYSLITCRGLDGEDIPGYTLPHTSNSISIDPITGDFVWDSPTMVGEYNIAILIQEWRHGILISQMVRDMQISIAACENEPPVINAHDTCIIAGNRLNMQVMATDPEGGYVDLSATGSCFLATPSPASFSHVQSISPVGSHLIWDTRCSHISKQRYTATFQAKDDGPQIELSTFKTVFITIIAPKPEHLEATSIGNTIHLSWDSYCCPNGNGFKIYRREGSNSFGLSDCETGMPEDAGHTLIYTSTNINDTLFIDDGFSYPLLHGHEYCYRIVATFPDGAESIVSDEACARLINDAPIMTHVDVLETDSAQGNIFIAWQKPSEYDSIYFHGPEYQYRIFRKDTSLGTDFQCIDTTYDINDTSITDLNLNTSGHTYAYRVEFWGESDEGMQRIEKADQSSSIHVSIESLDRQLKLSWNENVPWTNESYAIYRLSEDLHSWDSIATVENRFYIDDSLENEQEYCYYVMSKGAYYVPDTLSPLYNRSQKIHGIPIDNIPPEVPEIFIATDCETVYFSWHFTSAAAAAEVKTYYFYYKTTLEEDFFIIDSIEGSFCQTTDCQYELTGLPFVTGCFALAATDSNNNLSSQTPSTCFDIEECMDYRLPNVFTPNGDGANDLFQPFPYHNVEKIDMYIYNRWGRKVFHTEDPNINWDGTDYLSKQANSDGTYYYSCDVYLHSLKGLVVYPMHGTITLIRSRE